MSKAYDSPNYTQIPNELLDEILPEISTQAELKVTLAIARQTFGWHRREKPLSITRLQTLTGLSRQSVADGTAAALKRGFVSKRSGGQNGSVYALNVKNLGSQGIRPEVVKNLDPQVVKGLDPEKERTKERERKVRPEVTRLCSLMADLQNERLGRDEYKVSPRWELDMKRLLDLDGRSVAAVERCLRWLHRHPFWSTNVLSPGKLRKQWVRLELEARKDNGSVPLPPEDEGEDKLPAQLRAQGRHDEAEEAEKWA